MVVNYGASPYPTNYDLDRTIEGIITLKDRDGNISKGKLAEGTDLLTDNRYCIDVTNLKWNLYPGDTIYKYSNTWRAK